MYKEACILTFQSFFKIFAFARAGQKRRSSADLLFSMAHPIILFLLKGHFQNLQKALQQTCIGSMTHNKMLQLSQGSHVAPPWTLLRPGTLLRTG